MSVVVVVVVAAQQFKSRTVVVHYYIFAREYFPNISGPYYDLYVARVD